MNGKTANSSANTSMNIGQHTISTEVTQGGNITPKQYRSIEDKKESHLDIRQDEKPKKGVMGQLAKLSKYNQLPILDKKGGVSRGRILTPPPENERTDEYTVSHMTTHTRATHKIPLTDQNSKKNSRMPGKSLPRLIGGLRKLEKMPKSKAVDPLADGKLNKQQKALPKPASKPAEENTPKSNVFLRFHSKAMPGYSDGKIKINQDTVYCNSHVKDSKNSSLFACFDGHGVQGHKVSQYLKSQLTGIGY